jgi:uncharacterized protein (TIGR03067 family)
MKRQLLAAVAAALVLVAATRGGEPPAGNEPLQRAWRLASAEVNKTPVPLDSLKDGKVVLVATLEVKGDRYTFHLGKGRLEMTYKVIPEARPAAIDLTVIAGPQKGKTYHAVYRLEGDTYTVCRHVDPGKPRPTAFATEPDSGLMLVVWKRATPR